MKNLQLFAQILLYWALFSGNDCKFPRLLTTSVSIYLKEDAFINYMVFDANQTLIECDLIVYIDDTTNATINLSTETGSNKRYEVGEIKSIIDRIDSIGSGKCGLKFRNYLIDVDPKLFWLSANYTEDIDTNNQIISKFETRPEVFNFEPNETEYFKIGEKATIICGVTTQLSCKIYNPIGDLVVSTISTPHGCRYEINMVTMDHIGTWTCKHNVKVVMSPVITHIHAKLTHEYNKFDTWYKENDGFGQIGCKYEAIEPTKTPTYCTFTSPTKKELTVYSLEHATERYSSIGTNLDDFKCQIEFKLPLEKEEIGAWFCEIDEFIGGFIYTSDTPKMPKTIPEFPKYIIKGIDLSITNELTIKCNVPYSADNCYITSPAGILHSTTSLNSVGQCSYIAKPINLTSIGNWSCYFSRPDSYIDDIVIVEVVQLDAMASVTKEITADDADSVELLCKSGLPILYCRFVDASGNSYSANPAKVTTDMSYVGRGLEYGDCGMKINQIKPEHQGNWTCIARQGGQLTQKPDEVSNYIQIEVITKGPILTASLVGISIGAMVGALMVLSIAMYIRFRKNRNNQSPSVVEAPIGLIEIARGSDASDSSVASHSAAL